MLKTIVLIILTSMLLTFTYYKVDKPKEVVSVDSQALSKEINKQFLFAKPGDVIELPEGRFEFFKSLSLRVSDVTIKGAGKNKTILSFKQQKQGAEGIIATGSNLVFEGFAVEDTRGDGIKVNECSNLSLLNLRVEWTRGPHKKNGAYGLYPVQCENVLVSGNTVKSASDAGIYVGQSKNVIVKNNLAEYNVAGIEIENTIGADVFDNVAVHNTGGILIFNMPDLPQPGYGTRIFNNIIKDNNTENFGAEGTPVASVPAGSGIVINSNDQVEIFNNEISNNKTANVIISSFYSTGYAKKKIPHTNFDPYPETIYIYDNLFSGGGDSPDHLELKALKLAEYGFNGRLPDILWDGFINPEKAIAGELAKEFAICIDNPESSMINVDAANNYKNIRKDLADHSCHHLKLSPISLTL